MNPYYSEPNQTLYCGHALNVLKELPDESVDCVMTSPPYWGLRVYKTEPIVWGGTRDCEHEWGADILRVDRGAAKGKTALVGNQLKEISGVSTPQGNFCLKCNAWRGELGLEPTIELYVSHLILIFDEVKRVLKKTGTCWVNIGDSYAGSGCGTNDYRTEASRSINKSDVMFTKKPPQQKVNLPAKSLCAIPERFMLAMMQDGWIVRNDIIWYKSNPMPESVKDRFTGTYEHLYFFVKSKKYWFEQQFEPSELSGNWNEPDAKYLHKASGDGETSLMNGYNRVGQVGQGRNKRDVWEINTQPYPEAHFATFPEKLCETPILAGCPEDGTVLDPFTGSGTVLSVAKKLGRKGIGIELNPKYCDLTVKRLQEIPIAMELK